MNQRPRPRSRSQWTPDGGHGRDRSLTGTASDYDPLLARAAAARLVLIGEARELQLPHEAARDRVRGAFATLREAETPGEFEDVLSQLDRSYAELPA